MGDVMDFLSDTDSLGDDDMDTSLRACGTCDSPNNCGDCTVQRRIEILQAARDAEDDMAGEGDDDSDN